MFKYNEFGKSSLLILLVLAVMTIWPPELEITMAASTPITSVVVGTPYKYLYSFGDVWEGTWADDGNLYSTCDDSKGWNFVTSRNLTFSRLTGDDPFNMTGSNVNLMDEYGGMGATGPDGRNWKANGCYCVDGVIYIAPSRHFYGSSSGDPQRRQTTQNAGIIKSNDYGLTWTPSANQVYDYPMFPGTRFSTPFFVEYGKNGAASVDNANLYIYAVSNNGFWDNGDNMILGRVLRSKLALLNAGDWQYYLGGDGMLDSNWTGNMNSAALILNNPGKCSMTGITYIAPLERYIMIQWYYPAGSGVNGSAQTVWDFYEAPKPWGPWTKIVSQTFNPQGFYNPRIVPKFTSTDGRQLIVFTAGDFGTAWLGDTDPNNIYKLHCVPIGLNGAAPYGPSVPATYNNDITGTGTNQFEYVGVWAEETRTGCYNSDQQYTNTTNDYALFRFNGTGIKFYADKSTERGKVAVSVDGGAEITIDQYSNTALTQALLYDSGTLAAGSHYLKIRCTGQTSGVHLYITVDKVEVYTGSGSTPTPTPTAAPTPVPGGSTSYNDSLTGTGTNQFDFTTGGGWTYHSQTGAYGNDETYTNIADKYFLFRFNGARIIWRGATNNTCAKAAVSMDGGAETIIDCYTSTRYDDVVLFDSGTLASGSHTLKVRCTNQKNPSSSNYYITADRVEVFSDGGSVPTNGLVAYYPFNGNAVDASGSGNNGAVNGGASFVTGKIGQAIRLDGVNGYVSVNDSSILDLTNFTVSMWVNLDNLPSTNNYFALLVKTASDGNENYEMLMGYPNAGSIHFPIKWTDGSRTIDSSNAQLTAGTWKHIALTYDGTSATLYLDGIPDTTKTYGKTPAVNNGPLLIGNEAGQSRYTKGNIDEVRIYNRALSPSEVTSLYNYTGN